MIAHHDRVAGQGWKGTEDPFQSTHGAIPGGVNVREQHPFCRGQLIHLRHERLTRAAQATPKFRAKTFFQKYDDVEPRARGIAPDAFLKPSGAGCKFRVRLRQ